MSKKFIIDIIKEKRFKTSNVNYFDFHLNNKFDKDDVIINDEKIIHRNVHFFIEAIKFIIILIKYQITKIRLHRCFHDIVLK